jgi:hypothetical protein
MESKKEWSEVGEGQLFVARKNSKIRAKSGSTSSKSSSNSRGTVPRQLLCALLDQLLPVPSLSQESPDCVSDSALPTPLVFVCQSSAILVPIHRDLNLLESPGRPVATTDKTSQTMRNRPDGLCLRPCQWG